jgi:hypothetical protein
MMEDIAGVKYERPRIQALTAGGRMPVEVAREVAHQEWQDMLAANKAFKAQQANQRPPNALPGTMGAMGGQPTLQELEAERQRRGY